MRHCRLVWIKLAIVARRILLLITDLEIGGTPTVVRELASRLHLMPELCVEVACLSRWGPVAEQLRIAGISVTALGARGPADLRVFCRLDRLIRARGYDTLVSFLVHANAAAAVMKMIHPRLRCIQSIQTTQPGPRWHWMVQRVAQPSAEAVLVPSESVARVASDRSGIERERIVVIANAIEPDDFAQLYPEKNAGPEQIGFIGRLDPIKQVPLLVRQFAILCKKRDVHLHIFGQGSEQGKIEAEINRLGLNDRVTLHGVIAKPADALRRIGQLVLPSSAEGFGLVLIEAIAAGVPVVANDAPGIRDVVRGGKTGLLVNVDADDALAIAMMRLMDDAELRQRLIENGLREVRDRFSWTAVLPAYQALLGLEIPYGVSGSR